MCTVHVLPKPGQTYGRAQSKRASADVAGLFKCPVGGGLSQVIASIESRHLAANAVKLRLPEAFAVRLDEGKRSVEVETQPLDRARPPKLGVARSNRARVPRAPSFAAPLWESAYPTGVDPRQSAAHWLRAAQSEDDAHTLPGLDRNQRADGATPMRCAALRSCAPRVKSSSCASFAEARR